MFTCSCIRKLFRKKQKLHVIDDNVENDDNDYNYKITYDITPIQEEEEEEEEINIIINKNPNILTIDDFNESL